jgi:predicted dinucleotide-binding enzyme
MRIGTIGAGNIGQAFASLAIEAGHEVLVSNSRDPKTLDQFARESGALTGSADDAAAFGDLVLVAIPLVRVLELEQRRLAGKIVIDANNYYPDRDGAIRELDDNETTTSELVARRLPGARLVKAFNAILARDLNCAGSRLTSGVRRALPLAGNDAEAKGIVSDLVHQFGFEPFDAGALADSWRFERARPAYCLPLDKEALRQALTHAVRDELLPEGSWR